MTPIRAIFFDLGKTLIYPKEIWQPVLLRSDKALAEKLVASGVDVDMRTFPYEFIDRLNNYYAHREETLRETTTFLMLRHLLEEKGFRDVPALVVRAALDAKYAITQSNWHLELDAHTVLRALKLEGYQLALISNAGDDLDVQTLLDKNNLRHYFSFIRTSAACGYRKPHRHIFEEALNALGVFPEQCVMVGDTLDADIKGANELGIYSVWFNKYVNKNTKTLVDVHPQAVAQELSELAAILGKLS
jgi:putative hydrolase of the HAD superfamily